MSKRAPYSNQQILEEASEWFVAFRGQDPAESVRRDFHEWLKRSPEHIRAYLEIAAVYADIPPPELGRTPPELIEKARSSPEVNVFTLNPGKSPVPATVARSASRTIFVSRIILAAATLAFACIGLWFYSERHTYSTGVGEQRALTLTDGSIVELNARSKVRIAFHDRQRDVELVEGQALFRVASDHARPFVVHAGLTSVRAVGTQFDVDRRSTGTTVTVIEGKVTVESGTSAPEPLLAAGEQMIVTPMRTRKTERPNIAAATAWTRHQLVFDATPLSQVLEEFSRYSTRRLIIDSPELADLRISGQYTSTSPDSLLRFLSLQDGVVVTQVDGDTHIRQE